MADEGFLQRWSRRKAEAREPLKEAESRPAPGRPAEPPAGGAPAAPATPVEARGREADDAPVGEARGQEADDAAVDLQALPDIDTLTYESDFTAFMRKGVPPALRKRALQRLWRSHPTLANLDGLLEYGEDYTKIGTAKQVVRTAYQVGRGMLERIGAAADRDAAADPTAGAGDKRPATASDPARQVSEAAPAAAAGEAPATAARTEDGSASARRADRSDELRGPASKRRPLPKRG